MIDFQFNKEFNLFMKTNVTGMPNYSDVTL